MADLGYITNKEPGEVKRHYLVGVLFILIHFVGFSPASAVVSGVGGTDFLRTGVGARAQGLGYSFVAISDDATAGFWNPAGLTQLRENEFTTMSSEMFDVKYNYYGTALPVKFTQGKPKGVLGFGLLQVDAGTMERRDLLGNLTGTFGYRVDAFNLSYGYPLNKKISLGITGKYITQKLDTVKGSGFGFDVGFLYQLNPTLSLGLNFQDLYTKQSWGAASNVVGSEGAKDVAPMNLKAGIAYKMDVTKIRFLGFKSPKWVKPHPLTPQTLTFAIDADMTQYAKPTYHGGAEYWLMPFIAVRAGLEDWKFRGGLGLRLGKWNLDYSINNGDVLGDANRFSVGMKF